MRERINSIPGFGYYPHCGFYYDNYSEFFITISHHNLQTRFDKDFWPNWDKLMFKIDDDLIEASDSSSMAVLFHSQLYLSPDEYNQELKYLATIKICRNSAFDHQDIFNKALFYINSHYLANSNAFASLHHLRIDDDENATSKLEKSLYNLYRQRVRKRKDFENIEPLKIFNYACSLTRENQFLAFYRVLEYFFDRLKYLKVREFRFDTNIADNDLIKFASLKGESEHLKGLLLEITTPTVQRKLYTFAYSKGLLERKSFDELIKKLYDYRNSIVHAKESQIERTIIPDPFNEKQIVIVDGWIYIIKILANLSITYYNTV